MDTNGLAQWQRGWAVVACLVILFFGCGPMAYHETRNDTDNDIDYALGDDDDGADGLPLVPTDPMVGDASFILLSPIGPLTTARPVVSWTPMAQAVRYTLVLSSSVACEPRLLLYETFSATQVRVDWLPRPGPYFACLTATREDGTVIEAYNSRAFKLAFE